MLLATIDASVSDAELGRAAARAILDKGTDDAVFEERLTPEFARAAVDAISDGFAAQGLVRQILRGATHGASQLNVEEFHGLIEIIQNADDVGAREVRMAIRRKADGPELLVAHNGSRVLLRHVVAMSFAFLTTKTEETTSKGRFGIGLKTLARLGSNLEVHCAPYHFVVRGHGPRSTGPAAAIPGFYDPKSGETLFRMSLRSGFDEDEFRLWFKGLDAAHLLFLDTVGSVRLIDLSRRAKLLASHQLVHGPASSVMLAGPRGVLNASVVGLRDPRSRATWTRVTVDFPVPRNLARSGKATGPTSPISIAVGEKEPVGKLFAGLPLRVQSNLPFNLNAQFDPDTARVQIQHKKWNEWLFQRAADLISAAARWQFEAGRVPGWRWIPLASEATSATDPWLSEQLGRTVEASQRDLAKRLRVTVGDQRVPVAKVVYEAAAVEGLLTAADQVELRPSHTALPSEIRGSGGRWRKVLDDLAASEVVTVTDAVSMFGWDGPRLGPRSGQWCVRVAAAGLSAKLEDRLDQSWSVRLVTGARTQPPRSSDGFVLVSSLNATGLGADLGLVKAVDDAYFEDNPSATEVRRWLERKNRLRDGITGLEALEHLARGGPAPRHLDDRQVVALRDAFAAIALDDRRRLGRQVGKEILVDGFEWVGSKRGAIEVRPTESYLSASIDGSGRDSWPTAADRTPGLRWVHGRYRDLLKDPEASRSSGSDEKTIGARALFTLLGAETTPRLVAPPNPSTRYRDIAYPIRGDSGAAQAEAIASLRGYATHLRNDWDSPDLVAIVGDLVKKGARVRRPRSQALLRCLAKAWSRLYADALVATAVHSEWSWIPVGDVPTSWLSILKSEPWLSNKFGRSKPPRQLAFQSIRMLDAFGPNNALYGAEFEGMEPYAHVLEALGVQTFPHASRIVDALGELRRKGEAGRSIARDAAILYDALGQHAEALTGAITPDRRIDDLSVSQLRARFGIAADKPGLILAGGRWLPPNGVFRGPPIFGKRRPFVPDRLRSDRLWEVLNIQPPSIADCVAVLGEMADGKPDDRDEAVLIEVYRHLAKRVPTAQTLEQEALLHVPLWDGARWSRKRPIYAVDDPGLTLAMAGHLPMWQSPASIPSLGPLPHALGIRLLKRSAFVPSGIGPRAALEGLELQPVFRSAVQHLKSRFQRNDPGLYRALTVSWDALERAKVVVSPKLSLEVHIAEGSFSVPARAHVRPDPLPVLVSIAASDEAGSDETLGRAIAAIFDSSDSGASPIDREKLALAWAAAWRQASLGDAASPLDLPSEEETSDLVLSGFAADLSRGRRRGRVFESLTKIPQAKVRTTAGGAVDAAEEDQPVAVRDLKSASDLDVLKWEIVKPRTSQGPGRTDNRTVTLRAVPTSGGGGSVRGPANRAAPRGYTDQDIETLATDVLRRVLLTAGRTGDDFRSIRRLGADVVDDIGRFFEIKASYGPGADSVSLTAHEAKRAQVAKPGEFFLAVVTGLEKGYQTQVRIIPDPLENLDWGEDGSLTLTGLRGAGIVVDVDLR